MDDDDQGDIWADIPSVDEDAFLTVMAVLNDHETSMAMVDYWSDRIGIERGEPPTEAEVNENKQVAKSHHRNAVQPAIAKLVVRGVWANPAAFSDAIVIEKNALAAANAAAPERKRELIQAIAKAAGKELAGYKEAELVREAGRHPLAIVEQATAHFIADRRIPGTNAFGKLLDKLAAKAEDKKAGGDKKERKYQEWPPGWRPSSEKGSENTPGQRRLLSRMIDQGMTDYIDYLNTSNRAVWLQLVRLCTQSLGGRPPYVIPDHEFRQCILHLCAKAGDPGYGLPQDRQPPPPDDPEWDYNAYLDWVEKSERDKERAKAQGSWPGQDGPGSGEGPTDEQRTLHREFGTNFAGGAGFSMKDAIRGKLPPWQVACVQQAMYNLGVMARTNDRERRRLTTEQMRAMETYLGELAERYPGADPFNRMVMEHALTIPPPTVDELRARLGDHRTTGGGQP